jgi:hypothetical protein
LIVDDGELYDDKCLLIITLYTVEGVEFWTLVYDAEMDTARIVCELIDGRTLRDNVERVVLRRDEYPIDEASRPFIPPDFWELIPEQLAERRRRRIPQAGQ